MAFDTYIKIDTVDGEATQAKHEKWIEIYSFSWGASNPTTVGSGSGGLAGGQGVGLQLQRHEEDRGLLREAVRRLLQRAAFQDRHGGDEQGHRRPAASRPCSSSTSSRT